jgi:hypothetical protein
LQLPLTNLRPSGTNKIDLMMQFRWKWTRSIDLKDNICHFHRIEIVCFFFIQTKLTFNCTKLLRHQIECQWRFATTIRINCKNSKF